MTKFNKKALGLAGFAVGLLAMSGAASAASISYAFSSTDVGAFGAGPYGTVLLETNAGGGVNFTVTLRSDMNFVNTGGPHSAFSFNALNVAAGDISNILFNGISLPGFTVVSPGGNSPFGDSFSFAIDCTAESCQNGAPGATADPLTFTIANALLTDFGFNAAGTTAFFAADVICQSTVQGACNGATGAIGVTGPGTPGDNKVPEPATLALLGLGLLGLGMSRRRKAA